MNKQFDGLPTEQKLAAEAWSRRRRAVRATLLGDDGKPHETGKEFLDELRAFTMMGDTPFRDTERETVRMIGRQEVMQHILMLLEMDLEHIYRMYDTSEEPEEDIFP